MEATVKTKTLWLLIKGPVKELLRHSLEDGSLSFVTDKEGKHDYCEWCWIFEGACGSVWSLLWDIRRGLWDYVKLIPGSLGEGEGSGQMGEEEAWKNGEEG